MVPISPAFDPPALKGVTVYPNDPFKFDFILDKGEGAADLNQESEKLVKYFLASITTPENDLWVNLSPYEKNRIIPDSFGQTDMGRDVLAEDYILKQITASLIYPEGETGKKFWKRVYQEAAKHYGTTDIPVNTFNKVWIVPGHAKVYVHGNTAFVVQASLKVMLEQDYLALSKNSPSLAGTGRRAGLNAIGSQIVREIVIPELTKEVNEGKNFAPLRQVYDSLILAVWFKKYMKESVLGRQYMDQNKVSGLRLQQGAVNVESIYQRYLKAFKKGVYNYIKEEPDPVTGKMTPRKYFSGGWAGAFKAEDIDFAQTVNPSEIPHSDYADVAVDLDSAMVVPKSLEHLAVVVSDLFWHETPTGAPGSIVPRMLLGIRQNLIKEFKFMAISDPSKFESFINKGQGIEATILIDPDHQRDDPNNYYKVFYDGSGVLGLRELSYLKVLKGTPGVPQYLDWGRIGARGVWIHMVGIQNASSITVSDGKGHSIYSEVWEEMSPSQRRIALAEVAETLDHVHHRFGIGHGDVKPANIIIGFEGKKVQVKLVDWGLAEEFVGRLFGKTKGFGAPEIKMHEQTDTYSLGETILESLKLEGSPSAPLKELCERMKQSFAHNRPSLQEVAQKLREFAQEDVDRAMYSSGMINEQKVMELLGELWPEFVGMVHSNRRELDDRIKDAMEKGEEANRYGQNGEPEIIVKKGYADSLQFGVFYKGISIADVKLTVKQEYGGLDLVYLNPALRGNGWGARFVLKAIQYFKKFGKDKIHIPISEYGRTYWHDRIKVDGTAGDIYPIDVVRKKINEYLKGHPMASIAVARELKETGDKAQASGIVKYAYSPGPLHNVNDFIGIIDSFKSGPIQTAYYPGIGSDYKAAFDVTDADTIVGVESNILGSWARSSAFWGATNIYAQQEIDQEGRKRAVIRFFYKGKNRKLILYHEDINVLNPQKIPELKDGYDFLFLKGLPLSSYGRDFLVQSLSLLKENGLVLENNLAKGLIRTGENAADFSVIKRKSIGSFINSYGHVVNGLSIWQKTAPGGIDLTAKRMNLEVQSDKAAADHPMDMKVLENIEIKGIYIKDIEIKPLKNLPGMLGIPAS